MMMTWLLLAGLFGGMGSSGEAVLTFQEAWAEALRANPELRQAGHAARLAKLQFWEQQTRLFPWPSFTLEYTDKSYSTGGGNLPPTLIRSGVSQRGYTEILSARVTLFSPTWVEGWIRQRAAARVAALQAEDRRAQIRLELVKAYARALRAQEERALRQEQLEKERWTLQLALRRAELGAGSRLDVLNARVRVGQAEEQKVRAEQEWQQALAGLARWMGRPDPDTWTLAPVEVDTLRLDTAALRAKVLRAARALQMQRVQTRSAVQRAWWAWMSMLPSITYGWEWYRVVDPGPALDAFWKEASYTRGWSVSLTFPLDRYGFGTAEAREEAAMERARLRAVQLEILQQLRDHLAQWITLDRRRKVLEVTLDQAREAERLAETQYRLGAISLEDLLNARTRRLEVALQLLDVRLQQWTEWETLAYLTGGLP